MAVALAAVLAYRLHLRRKREEEEAPTGDCNKNDSSSEQPRTNPEEYYFERAESFGRNSTEFLQKAAVGCISRDTTTSSNNTSDSDILRRSKKRRNRRRRMTPTKPSPQNSPQSPTNQQDVVVSAFIPEIRQEWINAVFGPTFYPPCSQQQEYIPPRNGVGLSGIEHYVSYGVKIAPPPLEEKQKVGVTLSKIALGVWVKRVESGSEAWAAGVQEGSVLVDINGMGMLAEPSKQALERLWQYEGHFEKKEEEKAAPIVALTLIKNGRMYTAVFVSTRPFGISWAPCGNFPLVQRSYSFAQAAGLRRGCLVAAINQKSLRELDHVGAANELKETFESGQEICMTLVYTPAAARTGHFERQEGSTTRTLSRKKMPAVISQDNVEVRVHPLEYSIGSFLNSTFRNQSEEPQQKRPTGVSELAQKVASGQIEAPTGTNYHRGRSPVTASMSCSRTYGPCPVLSNVFESWHPMDALVYCLRFYSASFQQDLFALQDTHEMGTMDTRLGIPRVLLQKDAAGQMADAFLLQFVSMLCLSSSIHVKDDEAAVARTRARFDAAARDAKMLTDFLLKLAHDDTCFRQRLYFLLCSYTATLEGQRKSDISGEDDCRLPGLLQTLDLLQLAQKQLSCQLLEDDEDKQADTVEKRTSNGHRLESLRKNGTGPSNRADSALLAGSSSNVVDSSDPSTSRPSGKKKKSVLKVFHKKASSKQKNLSDGASQNNNAVEQKKPLSPRKVSSPKQVHSPSSRAGVQTRQSLPVSTLFDNMSLFLVELDGIRDVVERSLLKSVSQKLADWALQPWSPTKETTLAKVTDVMREGLRRSTGSAQRMPLVNPIESSELLLSVDSTESYILPSAHFPLLLTFDVQQKPSCRIEKEHRDEACTVLDEERLYRTRVEIVALRGSVSPAKGSQSGGGPAVGQGHGARSFFVQGAVAGAIKESGRSTCTDRSTTHVWDRNNLMTFDTRSSWGAPCTLAIRLSAVDVDEDGQDQLAHTDEQGRLHYSSVVGSCWVDLRSMWRRFESMKREKGSGFSTVTCHAQLLSLDDTESFDQHGDLSHGPAPVAERLELELRVTTETLDFDKSTSGFQSRKRMLLYKHDDDLRQEMFAIEFIKTCDKILKASGLDMKLLTFGCMPVGAKRGFIEWVPGSVPLSDVCVPFSNTLLGGADDDSKGSDSRNGLAEFDDVTTFSEVAKAGLTKYQYFRPHSQEQGRKSRGTLANNPIQEYFRSVAYDSDAPYLIQKDVMDTYVKSCAGYCVLTYLLGVGDRHLDNLLLHQKGHFFHCDYSFILGNDPKKYLPMRITEDMVHGMGGRDSDNYAMFLSLAGAAFVTFRRHENVRVLMSLVRLMAPSALPDVSVNRDPQDVLIALRDRLRLDLSDHQAVSFMEQLIETSITSKIWVAVDAIHSLGKRF